MSGFDSFGDTFEDYKDIPVKDGYLPYKSNTNGNWFVKRLKDQRVIASFTDKEILIVFMNAI